MVTRLLTGPERPGVYERCIQRGCDRPPLYDAGWRGGCCARHISHGWRFGLVMICALPLVAAAAAACLLWVTG